MLVRCQRSGVLARKNMARPLYVGFKNFDSSDIVFKEGQKTFMSILLSKVKN
jgi:hypothetical protein